MREIKFRAFEKEAYEEKGKMINSDEFMKNWNLGFLFMNPNKNPCNRLIIMQYTGLKDKNGKEIYEGDIVCINISPNCKNPITKNCKVWYSGKDAAFMCDWHSGATHLGGFTPITVFEVIGNIYENPELLQQ